MIKHKQPANVRECFTPLTVKIASRFHLTPVRMAVIKKDKQLQPGMGAGGLGLAQLA